MMLRRAGWCVLLAAIVLLATPGSEAMGKRYRKRPFLLRAHVVDFETGAHPRRRSRQRRFRAYETHTIEFDVFRRGRPGSERPSQVKLYLPNGDLYSALDLEPFDDDSLRKRRRPAATARVRVSGTMITRYGLYGKWRAEVCWETGSVTSCRRGLTFKIR